MLQYNTHQIWLCILFLDPQTIYSAVRWMLLPISILANHSHSPLPADATCLACFQDSSHCFIVLLASSNSCRSLASSAAPGPDRNAGEVLGEKLPEAKCSHMLLFIPFKPVSCRQEGGKCYVTYIPGLPLSLPGIVLEREWNGSIFHRASIHLGILGRDIHVPVELRFVTLAYTEEMATR